MLNRNLNITLIEDNIIWGDKSANLQQLKRNLRNLPPDTDIVVLPELFTTGLITGDRDQVASLAERNTGDTITMLHEIARSKQLALCGSFLAATAGQLYNRAFFIDPNGEDTFYDTRQLFSYGGEDKVFHHGHTQAPIIRFRGVNIKLIVCYELRFPVFCRNVDNNYDLLIVVANWPESRQRVWKTLLQARAIENECYVCGVNRCGTDGYGTYHGCGSSLVIDFKGNIIAERDPLSPLIPATIEPARLQHFREKFPVWRDADPFKLL